MTAARRTVLIFTMLWVCLALYQYARAARACADGSIASTLLWLGQFLLLAVPIVVLRRQGRRAAAGGMDAEADLSLILLAYVPVTVALHIAETCARR